jgi:hypothetical protein
MGTGAIVRKPGMLVKPQHVRSKAILARKAQRVVQGGTATLGTRRKMQTFDDDIAALPESPAFHDDGIAA